MRGYAGERLHKEYPARQNEDKAYKLIDNAYVKQADTCGGGAYSAMSDTIREKYIENTIDGNKLTIVYKVLFIGFEFNLLFSLLKV